MMSHCPLCYSSQMIEFQSQAFRRCGSCDLILKVERPSPVKERARYLTHNNNSDDAGYRTFLSPVVSAVGSFFPIGSRGLDFGSGPTPVLSEWLTAKGYDISSYDYFFAPEGLKDCRDLDFVCCVETAEHFFLPAHEFRTMFSKLRSGGALILMTAIYEGQQMSEWSYARDYTHVCFYSRSTLEWIARSYGAQLHRINERLFVFILDSSSRAFAGLGNEIDKNL